MKNRSILLIKKFNIKGNSFFARHAIFLCVKVKYTERVYMKYVRSLLFVLFLVPMSVFAAGGSDFNVAVQLLAAA